MKKKSGKTLMQKWKNKIGGKLSALDKKKLVLTNIPYALAAFYADRAFFLYRNSPGEDMGNKLLYAMEHADRIFAGFVLSNNWKDLLAGIVVAVVLKVLVIDSRYCKMLPLIVTTNLGLNEMKSTDLDTAHQRIYSRILEMCVPIYCGGEDKRKEEGTEKLVQVQNLITG